MADITEDTVKHIAHLSRIALHDDDAHVYAKHLANILDYVKQLDSINTNNVEALMQVSGLKNVLRQDVVTNSSRRDELLSTTPLHENGLIKVKVVK